MRCASDLTKIRDALQKRTVNLQNLCRTCQNPLSETDYRSISYATIELDNMFVTALRQYSKSVLLGARTAQGDYTTCSVRPNSPEEAAAFILAAVNPVAYANRNSPKTIYEKDELTTRDPKDMEKVFVRYQASNLPRYALALSLNSSAFQEVKVLRHFFAHRCKNTAEKVEKLALSMGILAPRRPEDLVLSGHPGLGVPLYETWTADLMLFFDLAT